MKKFGELKVVKLREIWKHEAKDFTPWLAKNIHHLGKALGLDLELVQREAGVGEFSLDLLVNDVGSNRKVVIENQLNETNHDHLGKLLTYASGFDASVVIWISEAIREEHRQALDWLNQRTDSETEFFGIIIEILQIDDSKPAYNFKPVVFPNDWQKRRRPAPSKRMEKYRLFFQILIDELREKHNFTNARKGQPQSWYAFSSGDTGIIYGVSFAQGNRVRVDLYIDQGDAQKNKALFDLIYKDKKYIESECDEKLEWERLENKRSSRIAVYRDGSIDNNDESLQDIKEWSINKILKMKKVFNPRLKKSIKEIKKIVTVQVCDLPRGEREVTYLI